MAKKVELRAVLSLDTSPFVRGTKHALATGKAFAVQFAKNPVKFAGTAALLGVEKGLRGAASGMKMLAGAGMGAAAAGFRTLAMAAPLAAAGMAHGITNAYNFGSELQDMADRTGIGVKNLVVLQTALKDSGVEFNALTPAIGKMQQTMVKAVSGDGEDPFSALGLNVKELINMDPGSAFELIGEGLAKMNNEAMRSDLAKKIFGRGGMQMKSLFADPNAMANARQAVGSQADVLGANSGTFDRISDILGHSTIKLSGFFVGMADGLSATLLPLLEGLDKIDLVGKGREFAALFMASFNYARDIVIGPIGNTFAWIADMFATVMANLQAVMEAIGVRMMNTVRHMQNAWDILFGLGQNQQGIITDDSHKSKVAKYKKSGFSLGGLPTGSGKTFATHLAEARAGAGMGNEGEIGGRGNWRPTPELPPWRLAGFASNASQFSKTFGYRGEVGLKGASMAGGLSRYKSFLSGGSEGSMRTLGMGDGSVTPLLRHSEMRADRNRRQAMGDKSITDIAAGDARRQKAFAREQARKAMGQGSDNQLLSSIVKNSATTAKVLKTTFNVQEGETEG